MPVRTSRCSCIILRALILCFWLLLAQADAPRKFNTPSKYANLLKKLKGTTPSGRSSGKLNGPSGVLPVLRNHAEEGMQNPAAVRATPIGQYGDLACGLQDIVLPTSTQDVAAAVRYYYSLVPPYQSPSEGRVKIRVASRIRGIPSANEGGRDVLGMGDRPGFSCPKGTSSDTRTAVVATQIMNRVLDRDGRYVTVQAGITVTQLIDFANANQLTLPLGTLPLYLDLTLGGLLSVGAHGAGPKGSSMVADMVTGMTFVDGTGKIHTVDRYCLEGRGLSGGLGMLGIITEVTLKLQPGLQKTKLWSPGLQSDANIEEELVTMIDKYSGRLAVTWRPDRNLVKYRVWEEVPETAAFEPPETPGVPARAGPLYPQTDAIWKLTRDIVLESTNNDDPELCDLAARNVIDARFVFISNDAINEFPGISTDGVTVLLDNATALTNDMQGSDCDRPASSLTGIPAAGSCFWDPRVFERIGGPSFTMEEALFAINLKHLRNLIADIRALAVLGGQCWASSIIQLRSGGSTPDLIGPASGAPWERFVWVELVVFRPNLPGHVGEVPMPPGRAQKTLAGLQEGFEQLMVCKYGARPHYGKLWHRVYASAACPIRDLYPEFDLQLKLQDQYDPAKIFETALLSTLIAGGEHHSQSQYPGCSNEMQCYCQTDEDCGITATGQAFKCKRAPAPLPPFKVCLP